MAYLSGHGWTILERNVRLGRDEIDIVALDPGPPRTLVFVEVRANRNGRFGTPEESVGHQKRRAVYRAALAYRRDRRSVALPWRVDLVALELAPRLAPAAGRFTLRHLKGLD